MSDRATRLGPSAHVDTFARDQLPPRGRSGRTCCSTGRSSTIPSASTLRVELTDRMVERGFGDHVGAHRQRPPPHLQGAGRLVEPHGPRPGRGLRRAAGQPRAHPLRQQPGDGRGLAGGHQGRRAWSSTRCRCCARASSTKIVDKAEIALALCDSRIGDELVACAKASRFLKQVVPLRRHRQPRRRARPRRARQAGPLRRRADRRATTSRCSASPRARPASRRPRCTSIATC